MTQSSTNSVHELATPAPTLTPIVSTSDVNKTVTTAAGELRILQNINIAIAPGESLAVVGASGSGKTTLLGLLAGLDLPTSGTIELAGEVLTELDEEARALLRGRVVGFVFQNFQLLASLSAQENVMLPMELRGDADAGERAAELLRRVGLDARGHHRPRELSGGEQQRVAIARAFACRPQVLFADEPTGNLDTATGARITDLLFELNADFGTTLVLVTHDNRLAERCATSVRLDAGRIVA
ncbi:MAG: ATP-binding cassette domain-containing protein [Pseudomonadota bacterium]